MAIQGSSRLAGGCYREVVGTNRGATGDEATGTSEMTSVQDEVARLAAFVRDWRVLVLSGAGISTESGIPDYRGPSSARRPRTPMRYQEFAGSEEARRRYWARSLLGWPAIDRARPNRGHEALACLEAAGRVHGIVTQNVDGLHQAAGSRSVLELHGSLAVVRCLSCSAVESRRKLQQRLLALNPRFEVGWAEVAPDGDAEIAAESLAAFRVPACRVCGGVLKPDVVFFGENVPARKVGRAWRMFEYSEALLVVGSSLTVFSGYRFAARAVKEGKPLAIVNAGPTRADAQAALRVGGRLGDILPALVRATTEA